MKKVVILGAFDRYNYGDNLMPILFEIFLKECYPRFFDNFNLVFSALIDSDLSQYKVKKTIAMSKVFKKNNDGVHSIISIGGEVLCASSSTLFLHMDNPQRIVSFVSFLRNNRLTLLADLFCRYFYDLPWEYPYIPRNLSKKTRVAFNTIGGGVSRRNIGLYLHKIRGRLIQSSYLSVRDSRTKKSLNRFSSPLIFPDSAIVMARFISDNFIQNESRDKINALKEINYICVQAAPKKAGGAVEKFSEVLNFLSNKYNFKIILCPIGYARGHDDIDFLKEIKKLNHSDKNFELMDGLNVWEIMSVIKYSKFFIGTSLHGVITSLSFSVPYVGLNPEVKKLDEFLKDWGIKPSNRCYTINEVPIVFDAILSIDKQFYKEHSNHLIDLALNNYHSLVDKLKLNE
ncbi:MAG: polysaccharide pyruvyl transferase family protein [Methyloprofundus sp.]|nr:polysaccharide pyruvyl transferase family protein [Methyloprofundus sp.]